jgi:hypothetical protein
MCIIKWDALCCQSKMNSSKTPPKLTEELSNRHFHFLVLVFFYITRTEEIQTNTENSPLWTTYKHNEHIREAVASHVWTTSAWAELYEHQTLQIAAAIFHHYRKTVAILGKPNTNFHSYKFRWNTMLMITVREMGKVS